MSTAASLPLTTSEEFANLRPEWEALYAACPHATVFQHPALLETWERHFPPGEAVVYLSIRQDEALAGVVPLLLGPAHARVSGDPEVMDFSPLLIAPGAELTVARGLLEWLNEDMTPSATVWGLAPGNALPEALAVVAESFGWGVEIEDEAVTPVATLCGDDGGDFETFVTTLPKKDRHELRRKLRNLDAAGEYRYEECGTAAEFEARFDRFLELMRKSRADKDAFLTPAMEAYFRDLGRVTCELGLSRLATLWLDDESVAMTWSFATDEALLLYNSGYDPGHEGLSLGITSKALAMRAACEAGLREFNFLRGDEDYKRRMGGEFRTVRRVQLKRLW